MKKILFVSPTGTLENGAEISITNLMVYLSHLGFEIYNVIPKQSHSTSEAYAKKMESGNIRLFSLETKQWWWETAPVYSAFTDKERFIYYQKNIFDIRKIIREEKIDIVISNTANVFQGAFAAASEKVGHIWLIHEFPLEEFAYYEKLLPFMEYLADEIVTVTGNLSRFISSLLGDKVKISTFIPYSQIDFSRKLEEGQATRIISIGRINENKNQLELLKAYRCLSGERPDLIFIGGWDESYKQKCDQYIAEQKLEKVQFLGNKSNPWSHVTDKDILVINSKMETFGLVYVESLINGVPVIASDNMGYQSVKEIFGYGEQYALGNIDELVSLLETTLHHFSDIKQDYLGQVENFRRKYSLEYAYQNILSSIESLKRKPKLSESLYPLFGGFDPFSIFYPSDAEKITIYFGNKNHGLSEEDTMKFPIAQSDQIDFEVEEGTTILRVDMTEKNGYFDTIQLVNLSLKTQILPFSTNGKQIGDSYYFTTIDPQIYFDLTAFPSGTYRLMYRMSNLSEASQSNFLPTLMAEKMAKEQEKNKELKDLQFANHCLRSEMDSLIKEKDSLQKQFEEAVYQYNSVVHSRRWTIPTKIINFLRRKK